MIRLTDEGYIDDPEERPEIYGALSATVIAEKVSRLQVTYTMNEREELVYQLLSSMSRSQIAKVHRRITPFLHIDIIGMLPSELSLLILSYVSSSDLLKCALVSKKWRTLADDSTLWKGLCNLRGWEWRHPTMARDLGPFYPEPDEEFDDEGMGEEEEAEESKTFPYLELDSGFVSLVLDNSISEVVGLPPTPRRGQRLIAAPKQHSRRASPSKSRTLNRHSAPSVLPSREPAKPNYKLLYQTHVLLLNRLWNGSYRCSTLQTLGTPNSHTSTIYCLQLYTYPEDGRQVLFTGSKDRTIREWNLSTGTVERVFEGTHQGSVLSLCVFGNYIASAGSDWRVCVWDVRDGRLIRMINDHHDSVLCVRFDEKRLVSCSKDRTIRTYLFPDLRPHKVLCSHRAAVNAVAIADDQIVSASGDKSMRLWDANTGALLRTFEGHHTRGLASIDFQPPFILSGSSDKHIRYFDVSTQHGWSTSPEFHNPAAPAPSAVCETCGGSKPDADLRSGQMKRKPGSRCASVHSDLVRSVALGPELVVSGSYDQSVKVWDRESGVLVADLAGGHEGRIFCVGFDCTKIVSCGEDQKICIWDLSHGIDTSFIKR